MLEYHFVSGNFSGKLRLYNGTEEIDILNGKFDINKETLQLKKKVVSAIAPHIELKK